MKLGSGRQLVFAATLLGCSGLAGTARAEEGVEKAVSVAVSFGTERNDTVHTTTGKPVRGDGEMAGLSGILSLGPVALGASAELSSSVNGIASHSVGGLAGVRLPVSPRLRLLVLGEAGVRTFSDVDDFLFETTVTPGETSLPYVGGRVGITWLVFSHFDLGLIAFARTNVGEREVTIYQPGGFLGGEATTTTEQLGGFSGGVAFQIGFRFDTTRPFNDPPVRRPVPRT